jgi:hypothetical protein
MFGHLSLSLRTVSCDSNIERTLRQLRAKRDSYLLIEHSIEIMAKEEEQPMLLRDHYISSTYTSLSCLQLSQLVGAQYGINSSIIQMLPSFYGLTNEDPYKHLDESLEIYYTIKM